MKRTPVFGALVCALWIAAFGATGAMAQGRGEGVRPEVGKPLQAAQALIKQRKGREAMAEIAKAEAVPSRTPYENDLIAQMKAAAASASGDHDATIRANEALLASGKVTGREALALVQGTAVAYYNKKDYASAAKWTQRYFKDGGNDPSMRSVLLQSYYLGGDCGAVNKMLASVSEEGGNGKKPGEDELQILANCHLKSKDTGGYVHALEKLVQYYPKKEYWTDLLNRVQKKPGFSDRLSLDVFRLKSVTGNLAGSPDYMEYAQLALQAGYPAEAKQIVEKAYAANVFSDTTKEAERQKRLKALITKELEDQQKARDQVVKEAEAGKDGTDLVKVGVNLVYEGQAEKGVALAEKGIKKGGLKRPEDAKLQLGEAMVQNGQRAKGVQVLKTVGGTDGTADLARLWVLYAQRS
ncbi:hypothetical protein [Usitatibacter palustris]|uniref:Tetratricopeptide repeat-containing protein n=1 Tax=Usitatibacter palustris TaxID=2732487 RepID=A0A6M4HBJ9_9PROT|nr:hypothetical protein [Usitatibacter palustris]QJR16612.1 hypothetical protein DSM104440_03447 [Usitatibacter palustris]